jgi:hypothetical protein
MRKAQYTAGDVALAMRLNQFAAEEVSKAMTSAKFGKDEIASALTYAGYEEDGSFSRWAEASIVYDAGVHAARWLHGRKAIVTLSAKNLKLWTKYSGLDPEVAQNPELSGNFGTLWDLGYDNPVSPLPRYFILKVTLGM